MCPTHSPTAGVATLLLQWPEVNDENSESSTNHVLKDGCVNMLGDFTER